MEFSNSVRSFAQVFALSGTLLLAGCGGEEKDAGSSTAPAAKQTVTMYTDNIGKQYEVAQAMAKDFEAETGIAVQFRLAPQDTTERLAEVQKFFAASNAEFDVLMIDVIWPGLLSNHLEDVGDVADKSDFFPSMIDNTTVDGRMVSVPYYTDAGLLYYRTDLLAENGFDGPPKTWEELENMAKKIQETERGKGNSRFFGYVFQGAAYEGLTCNALEWQTSAGAAWKLSRGGPASLDIEKAAPLFDRIRGWIGTISPEGVLSGKEEEARMMFGSGNAAFMRNWPYAYNMGNAEGSPVAGKFDVTTLPSGGAASAATLGGWNLAVSKYSKNKEASKKWIAYLSTREAQRRRAIEGSFLATRPDVYGDPEITAVVPFFDTMRDVLSNSVPRPSTPSGADYNEISAVYYQAVHDILSGRTPAADSLRNAEQRMTGIMASE